MDQAKDFIYNLIRYTLVQLYRSKVTPIKYTDTYGVFQIITDRVDDQLTLDSQKIKNDLKKLAQSIVQVKYLYDLEDPMCFNLSANPKLEKGIFSYNPWDKVIDINKDLETVLQAFECLNFSKKVKLIRVDLNSKSGSCSSEVERPPFERSVTGSIPVRIM